MQKLTVLSEKTIVLQYIENTTHLAEDEDSGPLRLHRRKQFIKDEHLARVFDEMFVGGIWRARFLNVLNFWRW